MKLIPVDSLQVGMQFTEHLFMDDENIIVSSGIPLAQRDIKRLKSLNISHVRTDGEQVVQTITYEALVRSAFQTDAQKEVTQLYTLCVERYADALGILEDKLPVDSAVFESIVEDIISLVENYHDDIVQYILYGKQGKSNEAENALNASIISILIAQEFDLSEHKVRQLSTSCLLRDCGMLLVPPEIRKKKEALSDQELHELRLHPIHSNTIITKSIGFPSDIGVPAMQHHEWWNGRGYPHGIKGREIMLHARIIAVADSFEAMISKRSYRSAIIGHKALRVILQDNAKHFDSEILRPFLRTLGIYPIGSLVQLSNAAIGRVVKNNPDAPIRPIIKIMINEEGSTHYQDDGEIIDLKTEKDIFIARAIDPNAKD